MAVNYIEPNLHEAVNIKNIADHVYSSSDYFQKMLLMVTGFTVSEYIRNRKLSLAGHELSASKSKVIDVALKYGYETHESFTKAFTRFHGFAPSMARSSKNQLRYFYPFTIEVTIKGGFGMSQDVSWWEENNLEVHIFENCPGGLSLKDPSSKEIEDAIENLGKSEDAPDFDFLILCTKNMWNEKCVQGGFFKDSGEYLVEALHYYDFGLEQHRINTTDVNVMKKIFTDFASGIAPDVTNWELTFTPYPKDPKEELESN